MWKALLTLIKRKKKGGSFFFSWPLLLVLFSCDFSSQLQKDIFQAQEFILKKKYKEAVQEYSNILEKNPQNKIKIKVLFQLGEIYSTHLGNLDKALDYYGQILKLTDLPSWLVKALDKMANIKFTFQKDYRGAAEYYEKLVNFTPKLDHADEYENRLAHCFMQIGEYAKAETIFREIGEKKQHRYNSESLFNLGLVHFYQSHWSDCIYFWKEYLKTSVERNKAMEVKMLLANAYEGNEKLDEAYKVYYSLIDQYPNKKILNLRLKKLYLRRKARKR